MYQYKVDAYESGSKIEYEFLQSFSDPYNVGSLFSYKNFVVKMKMKMKIAALKF